MAGLTLDNLSKTYAAKGQPEVHAVRGVSLEIESGQCLAITGASGGGKTTLLMMLAGLVEPTGGSIILCGRSIDRLRPDARNIAMVFQHDALYPHLSARKHLALSLKAERVERSARNGRIEEIAGQLGISDCLGRKPSALSGGQRRRLALGRAMVRKADLMLLDEPLVGVDPEMGSQIRDVLRSHHERSGVTTLLVTHDHDFAAELGDRVVSMSCGSIDDRIGP